jgi:hypothetical protein
VAFVRRVEQWHLSRSFGVVGSGVFPAQRRRITPLSFSRYESKIESEYETGRFCRVLIEILRIFFYVGIELIFDETRL